jgi:hypothetical protein
LLAVRQLQRQQRRAADLLASAAPGSELALPAIARRGNPTPSSSQLPRANLPQPREGEQGSAILILLLLLLLLLLLRSLTGVCGWMLDGRSQGSSSF